MRHITRWMTGAAMVLVPLGPAVGAYESGEGRGLFEGPEPEPAYAVSAAYVPSSRMRGYDKTAVFELQGDWAFAYFWEVLGGEADVGARLRSFVFTDSADVPLPDQVAQVALNARLTWEFVGGTGFQVAAYPGLYSDFEDLDPDMIYLPVACTVAGAFDSELSGFAGFGIRPRFERLFMPIVGLDWRVADNMTVRAGMPQSRLVCRLGDRLSAHGAFEWQSLTFSVEDAGKWSRDQMTLEDSRLYAGFKQGVSEQLRFTGDAGLIFDRSVDFDGKGRGTDRNLDADEQWFLRMGLEGSF